jgi:hypothetical protein
MLLARMQPWHWWLGVGLTGLTLLSGVGLFAGYLKTVVRPQYPPKQKDDD